MNGPQAQTSRRTDPRGLIARAAESLRRERVRLEGTKEALIARRTHLYSIHGPAARQRPEWDSITAEMEEADAQFRALQQKLDPAAS